LIDIARLGCRVEEDLLFCYCYFFFPFKSVVFAVDLQGYIYIFFKKKTRKKIIFVVRVEFF